MSTALVTGASAGIGLAFARELAARGHDLVLVARDEARLQALAHELGDLHGVQCEVLVADLADRAAMQRVADRAGDRDAPVDLLVNNAGFGLRSSFLRGDIADEEQAVEVMIRAVMVVSQAAARAMVERGHGAIVVVSSVASYVSMGTYSAVKAWARVFTEGLATELAGTGVTATALCPGFTHTEFHDRAELRMGALPEALWLDADQLVRDCLADVARGRVVSVPGRQYQLIVGALAVVPRGVVRRVTGLLAEQRRTRRARSTGDD